MPDTTSKTSRTVQLQSPLGDPTAESRLRTVLRNALRDAIGLGMVGMVACASPALEGSRDGDGADGNGNNDGGTTPTPASEFCKKALASYNCTVAEAPIKVGMFNAPSKPDYLAVHVGAMVQASAGQSCDETPDPEQCKSAINAAILRAPPPVDSGVPPFYGYSPEPRYLLARKGNEVAVFTSPESAAKFLAPIDNAAEALLVAGFWKRLNTECSSTTGVSCEENTFVIRAEETNCEQPQHLVEIRVPESGSPIEQKELGLLNGQCVVGRVPDGCQLASGTAPRWDSYAGFLGESAALEAASVPAFLMLADDLRTLSAPSELIEQAMRSARDEVRHAGMIATLSSREGEGPVVVQVPRRERKSLFQVARENAVEGCIRETYGALVGNYQAQFATDLAYRKAMASIADDETQHAELSHRIAAWVEPQLSDEERTVIAQERRAFIAGLRASVARNHAPEIHDRAGYPRAEVALAMLDALEENLWVS